MGSVSNSKPPANWTAKYWQWIYSKPKDRNPLRTGEISIEEFMSLPCTGGGEDSGRKVTLSERDSHKDILIPVFASEYCTGELPGASDDELLRMARSLSKPEEMEVTLDGTPLTPHYIETDPFEISVPNNHMLENEKAAPGFYRAIACGYWCKINGLAKGKHLIKFGGSGSNGFFTRVVYEISVPDTN